MMEKSYVISVCTDSDFYIPNAEHIERNDHLSPWGVPDDITAAQAAIKDGICLICDMDGVPENVYLDTPQNRNIIAKELNQKALDEQIEQNKAKVYSDMPDCIRLLSTLETELGGNSGNFAEWLRAVYELNDDFDETPATAASKLCTAFREVKERYGMITAQTLYNAQEIVLCTELMPAAMCLHCGGDMEAAKALARNGFFMESYDYNTMCQAVQFMADGGAADEVYEFITQNKKESLLQADASELSMTQSL